MGWRSEGFLSGVTGSGDKYWRLNVLTCGGCAVSMGNQHDQHWMLVSNQASS